MSGMGYAEVQVDLKSGLKISKLINRLEEQAGEEIATIPINKLHATLMYDVSNPKIYPTISNTAYKAEVVGIDLLGELGSKWGAAVLLLKCPELINRFNVLKNMGFNHSYDELLLHVSLSYGEATSKLWPLLQEAEKKGELPSSIVLCKETWSVCDD